MDSERSSSNANEKSAEPKEDGSLTAEHRWHMFWTKEKIEVRIPNENLYKEERTDDR